LGVGHAIAVVRRYRGRLLRSSVAFGVGHAFDASLNVASNPRAFAFALDAVCAESPTVGEGHAFTCVIRSIPPLPLLSLLSLLSGPRSQALGVAHAFTCMLRSERLIPMLLPRATLSRFRCRNRSGVPFAICTTGVDHAEHALALVDVPKAGTTAKDWRLDRVTHSRKLLSKLSEVSPSKPLRNILEPAHGGATLVEDSGEVDKGAVAVAVRSVVLVALPLAGTGIGLAGWAGDEQVNESPQRLGVHARDAIAPNRSAPQGRRAHPGQERGRGCCVPLDVTHGLKSVSESFEGKLDAGIVEA